MQKNKFEFVKVDNLLNWKNKGKSKTEKINLKEVTEKEWNFIIGEGSDLLKRLNEMPTKLKDIAHIFVGLQTSADNVYIMKKIKELKDKNISCLFSNELEKEVIIENEILKPFLISSNIESYSKPDIENYLIFPYEIIKSEAKLLNKEVLATKYPHCWKYLLECKNKLLSRADVDKDKWWHYPYPKNLIQMEAPKLVIQVLSLSPRWIMDDNGLYMTGGGGGPFYGLRPKEDINILHLLGILNSKLFHFVIENQSTKMRGGYIRFSKQYIMSFPIPNIDFKNTVEKKIYEQLINSVKLMMKFRDVSHKTKTSIDKTMLQRQINATNKQIDQLVYELYGLSEKEITIIEESNTKD